MDILLWIIIIGLFLVSFATLFFPSFPSVLVVWGGFFLYHFFIDSTVLTSFFWASMVPITIGMVLADILTKSLNAEEFGGSKWGERFATGAMLIDLLYIYPPFGNLIFPFIIATVVEGIYQKSFLKSLKAGFGALLGSLGGGGTEALIQFVMVIWFFLYVFL